MCVLLAFVPACVSRHQPAPKPQDGPIHVVKIQAGKGVEIRPVLASDHGAKSESFRKVVERARPVAAINGTFYSPELIPLGDVVIDGKVMYRGGYPNAIAMRKNGRIEMIRRTGKRFDWSGYKAALASGPRLVHRGLIDLNPTADGFSKKSLVIVAPRSGIGLTRSGELLMVVQDDAVTLAEFAQTMLEAGAVEAMNLDGGPACGLYHDGKMIVDAPLPMTNVLCVFKSK